jgi:hypothetical protein
MMQQLGGLVEGGKISAAAAPLNLPKLSHLRARLICWMVGSTMALNRSDAA